MEARPARRTEYELEEEIVKHISAAPGLVLALFSPIDVDRLVTYLKASIRTGRTFVTDAYSAYVMYLVHKEIKLPDPRIADCLRVYFNKSFERRGIKKLQNLFGENRIELGEILQSPEKFTMCFRPSNLKLDFDRRLPNRSKVLYSYWNGYVERDDWVDARQHLRKFDGEFIPAHTSGHIYVDDIVNFVEVIDPVAIIPIHTFEPMLFSRWFQGVKELNDGEIFSVG